MRIALLLIALWSTALQAFDPMSQQREDPAVIQLRNRRERASEYLIERASFVASADYEAEAAAGLSAAKAALDAGDWGEAYDQSWDTYKAHSFSQQADDLLHIFILAATERGKISKATNALIDLWYRFPAYDGFDEILAQTLNKAETLQNPTGAIDWSAEEPRNVINRDAVEGLLEADMFFRFLAEHGDHHNIAPRANLGLARSILIGGYNNRDRLAAARLAYMDLLQNYPESDQVFDALCEYALCHLLGFRGDRFDGGVLDTAAQIIDQAELYTNNQPERNALIQRYRALITRWHQHKDFAVARWYDRRGHERSALYYYRIAVTYDNASETARQAQRAIARLEPIVERLNAEEAARTP